MTSTQLQKILLVEDDPDIREIATLTLETLGGFTIKALASGKDAVDEAQVFQPDLVLLDVMMPDMSGPETLAALREVAGLRDIPVVFMTAKTQAAEIERFMNLGAIAVIRKPFDPMLLSAEISDVWTKNASGSQK